MKKIIIAIAMLIPSIIGAQTPGVKTFVTYTSTPWSSTTLYALNDMVTVGTGSNLVTYISLNALNLNNNPASTVGTSWNIVGSAGGGSSSGVTQIIAGSGISLSPTGGTGAVTIAATGGGGLPSGTGVVAVNGGIGALATPSQVVTAQSYSYGSEFYADSTGCATGASATTVGNVYRGAAQNSYPGLLMSILGGDLENYCYPGDTSTDTNNWVFLHADNEGVGSPSYFVETGINNARNANATNVGYQNSTKYGELGMDLFVAIPRANKTFAQDSAVTQTGFTADTTYQYKWGVNSTTSGSVFNCPVTIGADGNMVVWALQKDGNGGTWTGIIDSGAALVDPVTASTTFTAAGYGGTAIAGRAFSSQYVAYIFGGLSAGTHTFHGTVTSATGAGNIVDFGGCAGLAGASANIPHVFITGTPYQNSGSGGASDSTTAIYDTIASSVTSTIAALPAPANFVDVRSALLNAPSCGNGVEATMFTNCYSDNIHQNNTGYAAEVNNPSNGYAAVVAAVNPILTAGAIKNPRTGPMNTYQFGTTPIDTSHWASPNANSNIHGYGVNFYCANGGQNCESVGDLPNYGLSLIMAGSNFNLLNCPGTVTPVNASNCTQFITAQPNGALGFFATGGTSTGFDYFVNNSTYLGGLAGYQQAGVWLTAAGAGVSTLTAAVSGTNQNSNPFRFRGNYWNGTANQPADILLTNIVGTGTTPSVTLTLSNQYNGGTFGVDFSNSTQTNKLGLITATSIIDTGLTSAANPICAAGTGGAFSNTLCSLSGYITAGTNITISGSGTIASPFIISSTGSGGGGVTGFTAPSGSWPTWLVPTVTNPTTTPSLTVAASSIPNSALANAATTVNGQTCTLGSTCTISGGTGNTTTSGGTANYLPVLNAATTQVNSVLSQDSTTSPTILTSSVPVAVSGAANGALKLTYTGTAATAPGTNGGGIVQAVASASPFLTGLPGTAINGFVYRTLASGVDQESQASTGQITTTINGVGCVLGASCTTGNSGENVLASTTTSSTALAPNATQNTVTLTTNFSFTLAAPTVTSIPAQTCMDFIQTGAFTVTTTSTSVHGLMAVGTTSTAGSNNNYQCFRWIPSQSIWLGDFGRTNF